MTIFEELQQLPVRWAAVYREQSGVDLPAKIYRSDRDGTWSDQATLQTIDGMACYIARYPIKLLLCSFCLPAGRFGQGMITHAIHVPEDALGCFSYHRWASQAGAGKTTWLYFAFGYLLEESRYLWKLYPNGFTESILQARSAPFLQ